MFRQVNSTNFSGIYHYVLCLVCEVFWDGGYIQVVEGIV